MKCLHCGAEIESNSKVCQYCGSEITASMQKEKEQLNKEGCPKCGSSNITFTREKQGEVKGKKGTTVVHSTVGMCRDCGYTWTTTEEQKTERKTWLWVLGWICIFPVPLTILMLRKKDLKPLIKYGIIAVAWIVYFLIAFNGNSNDANTTSETTAPIEQSAAVENTDVADTSDMLKFTIVPGEKGEYGFENTLNAGTDGEETQVVYHIPAGTYNVTNLGKYQGQIGSCTDETYITEEGWEEAVVTSDQVVIKPGETAEFTIDDGYYLEVHVNGNLEFVKIK